MMAEIKGLIDDNGVIYECNKILQMCIRDSDNHKSYTTNFTNGNITVDFGCNRVKLPKLKGIKAKLHRRCV